MITVWFYNSKSQQFEEEVFVYPEVAVEFINNNARSIFVTGYSCVDNEDAEYICARI